MVHAIAAVRALKSSLQPVSHGGRKGGLNPAPTRLPQATSSPSRRVTRAALVRPLAAGPSSDGCGLSALHVRTLLSSASTRFFRSLSAAHAPLSLRAGCAGAASLSECMRQIYTQCGLSHAPGTRCDYQEIHLQFAGAMA